MTEEIILRDLFIVSAVTCQLKMQPKLRKQDNTVLFIFSASDELQEAINYYHSGGKVPAVLYAEIYKTLRSQMYELRNDGKL